MKVPFVDLKAQYQSLKPKIDSAIQSVINEAAFIGGKYVDAFEKAYAEAYNIRHCISVANGTEAIYISLKALGIGPGDEVITAANSWISTSEVITQTGAKVVFADIEPGYYNIDAAQVELKITSKTKAIIPVHLFGHPANIDTLRKICDKHNLFLVEDCAQAHFAQYKRQKVGTFGTAGTFSFYPGKNLGAYGDAGAIITNDDNFAIKARMFSKHGALQKHKHEIEGINSRMDSLQAAVLSVKLSYIQEWNQKRFENAQVYSRYLSGVKGIKVPIIREKADHVFHLYVVRTEKRDELRAYLKEKGIATGIHYPTALPLLPAYRYLGHISDDFPIASKYQNEILSLPMYPELTIEMLNYVVEALKAFFTYH